MGNVTAVTPTARMTHTDLIALHVSGWTEEQLAERFGYTKDYVRQILANPDYMELQKGLRKRFIYQALQGAAEVIQKTTMEAALTTVHLMRTASSEQVRLRAAQDLMDRGGLKAKEVVEVRGSVFDEDAASLLLEALKESKEPEPDLEMVQDSSGVFMLAEEALGEVKGLDDSKIPEKPKLTGGYGEPI